jgi:cellulose biosynthesis protein BcsQ
MAANLAWSLARAGSKVLAIDFDVQNALRLHFGADINGDNSSVRSSLFHKSESLSPFSIFKETLRFILSSSREIH